MADGGGGRATAAENGETAGGGDANGHYARRGPNVGRAAGFWRALARALADPGRLRRVGPRAPRDQRAGFSTTVGGSGSPFLTKRIEIELTQWRVFFAVMRSPVNTWPR